MLIGLMSALASTCETDAMFCANQLCVTPNTWAASLPIPHTNEDSRANTPIVVDISNNQIPQQVMLTPARRPKAIHLIIKANNPTILSQGIVAKILRGGSGYFWHLHSIFIPERVVELGYRCFYRCYSLKHVTFAPNSQLQRIGKEAFLCYLQNDIINRGPGPRQRIVRAKNHMHKRGCHISRINIPDSVTVIDKRAFIGCEDLKHVIFTQASKLRHIGSYAFSRSSIRYIQIPNSVSYIGKQCFLGCIYLSDMNLQNSQLTRIHKHTFGSANFSYRMPEYMLFKLSWSEELLLSKGDKLGAPSVIISITIPDSVRKLCSQCFDQCPTLTNVVFGKNSQLMHIGIQAFRGCSKLKRISIPDDVRELCSQCFDHCSNLTNVTFGKNSKLMRIGRQAFRECYKLETISIPDGVVSLCSECFINCSTLCCVIFGNMSSVELIKPDAFSRCPLCKIYAPENTIETISTAWDQGMTVKLYPIDKK